MLLRALHFNAVIKDADVRNMPVVVSHARLRRFPACDSGLGGFLQIHNSNLVHFKKSPKCFSFLSNLSSRYLHLLIGFHFFPNLKPELLSIYPKLLLGNLQRLMFCLLPVKSIIDTVSFKHIKVDDLLKACNMVVVHYSAHSIDDFLLPIGQLFLNLVHVRLYD